MAFETFRVSGEVVDKQTRRGVSGLKVEVWDLDTKYHDLLGVSRTDARGRFSVAFDQSYFGEAGGRDVLPDLFFRIFRGGKLLRDTRDEVMRNAPAGDTHVTLEVELPRARPPARDRVSPGQLLRGSEFVRKSDFAAVRRDVGQRTTLFQGILGDVVKKRLGDLEPVRPPQVSNREVAGQDVGSATSRLGERDVEVREVKKYEPGVTIRTADALNALTARVRPGDQVDLYEVDGKVRYMVPVRLQRESPAPAPPGGEPVEIQPAVLRKARDEMRAELRDELRTELRTELRDELRDELRNELSQDLKQEVRLQLEQEVGAVREEARSKDAEIARLAGELDAVRSAQGELQERVSPEKLDRLEAEMTELRERVSPDTVDRLETEMKELRLRLPERPGE